MPSIAITDSAQKSAAATRPERNAIFSLWCFTPFNQLDDLDRSELLSCTLLLTPR